MADKILTCPQCNNYVEGKRVLSNKGKATRTISKAVAKEMSKDVVEMGTISAGAVIGTLICPGVGTVIGGAAGWIGKALANDAIGKKVDQAADYLEDEYTDIVYQYSCPKCGHTWTSENEYYENIESGKNIINNAINHSNRTELLKIVKVCSKCSNLLDEFSNIDNVYIDNLKRYLQSIYHIDLSTKEISSCKTVGNLINLIESKLK